MTMNQPAYAHPLAGLRSDYESGDFTLRELEQKWGLSRSAISVKAKAESWARQQGEKPNEKRNIVRDALKGNPLKALPDSLPGVFDHDKGRLRVEALVDIQDCAQALLNARRIIELVGLRLKDQEGDVDPESETYLTGNKLKVLAETNNHALATIIRMRELVGPKDSDNSLGVDHNCYRMIIEEKDDLPESDTESDLRQIEGSLVAIGAPVFHPGRERE